MAVSPTIKPGGYIPSITPLRGIAALVVVLVHTDVAWFPLESADSNYFLFRTFYYVVDFFFMISGFIMMNKYGKLFSEKVHFKDFKQFILARFARVYPMHIFSFLLLVILYVLNTEIIKSSPAAAIFNVNAIASNVFLLQSMGLHHFMNWNIPGWSISTEWWMYMLFPFLVIPFLKIKSWKRIYIIVFIMAGYLLVIYYLYPIHNAVSPHPSNEVYSIDVTVTFGFVRCFLGFIFGMLLYELFSEKWYFSRLHKSGTLLLAGAVLLVLYSFHVPDVVIVFLLPAVLLTAAHNNGTAKAILNLKPFTFLGEISYSIYMMHVPLMFFIQVYFFNFYNSLVDRARVDLSASWSYAIIYLVLLIICSTLVYRFIEVPARHYLNRKFHPQAEAPQTKKIIGKIDRKT